jgi:hypothetical protein
MGLIWVGLGVMVLFSGLCTVFTVVITAAQAWQEHAESQWSEATAHLNDCDLKRTSSDGSRMLYIQCRLTYSVGTEQNAENVHSMNFAAPEVWQYPPNQAAPFEEWVQNHPDGTPIVVRYDPANHANAVLAGDYMPHGGPHTPSNLKLMEFCAGSFLVLLTIWRIARPRFLPQNAYSSVQVNP